MNTTTTTPTNPTILSSEQKNELGVWREQFNHLLVDVMENNTLKGKKLNFSKIWPETQSLPELYEQLSDLHACLDSFRPFNSQALATMNENMDIQYTYESNGIEGNSLTLGETALVLQKGLTIGGKPLQDHLEVINHQAAINYIRDLAKDDTELSEYDIKSIHSLILKGIDDDESGVYRKTPVFVITPSGDQHEFPQPYIVPKLMEDYFIFYNENKEKLHPVAVAAHLHQKLVNIHPFIDGNGRTARLVMNLYLFKHGYPVSVIDSEPSKRKNYYQILSDYEGVMDGDSQPFELLIAEKVKESFFSHLRFFMQDMSDSSEEKGYLFFKKIAPLLK